MDLGSSSIATSPAGSRSGSLLAEIAEDTATLRRVESDRLLRIVQWVEEHTVSSVEEGAATLRAGYVDTGVPIAGEGAPLVSEFALMDLSATLNRSTRSGREYVGKVVELAFRLPLHWTRVRQGRLEPWRALAIADRTRHLPESAASYVDHHLVEFAATCTWAQIDRLVAEALVLFDPDAAEAKAEEAAESRFFNTGLDQPTDEGTAHVSGVLDLPDALDLEHAVADLATQLRQLGSEETLDVRRSQALGELARGQQTLELDVASQGGLDTPPRKLGGGSTTGSTETTARHISRAVTLYLHLSQDAVEGYGRVAECANTRSHHPLTTIQRWIRDAGPDAQITIRPVRDLTAHDPVDAYAVPDRHREQIELRDRACAFPHCDKPATRCDADHVTAHGDGGITCPCNLAPCCRQHHRAKTHSTWRYVALFPGVYLWTSPSGRQFLVDRTGTRDLTHTPRCPATDPPDQ